MLTAIVFLPAIGALLVVLLPESARRQIKAVGVLTTAVVLGLTLAAWASFRAGEGGFQLVEQAAWMPSVGIGYHLGVDGVSLFLVVLNALLYLLGAAAMRSDLARGKAMTALLLLAEVGTTGVLLALDLILFYVFWEAMLIPLYFLIGIWGEGPRRVYAAFKFVLYTVLGSFFMLLAILALAFVSQARTHQLTFDFVALAGAGVPAEAQFLLFAGFLVAFAVKVPIFPLHAWLPDAYAAAPLPVILVLAGLVSKLGAYGLIRFNLTLFPGAARDAALWLASLAVVGILYGAVIALVQTDLKRMVAYASLSHVNFIALGIFSLRPEGIEGAIIQMVNHGVIVAALFLIVAAIESRAGTRDRTQLGGMARSTPVLAALFLVVALAALGLPGLNGFVGEFLIMLGAWALAIPLAVGAGLSVVLAAWYMLRVYQGAMQDAPPGTARWPDLRPSEVALLAPLLGLIIAIGVFPKPIPDIVAPSVALLAKAVGG
jgi:NADH-quinone oxidoreductase subunit M